MSRRGRSVRLRLPAEERYLRLVRIATGSFAALLGCPPEQVDDLRVASTELCHALIAMGGGGRMQIDLGLVDQHLLLRAVADHRTERTPWDDDRFDLSRQLLAHMGPTYEIRVGDNTTEVELRHPVGVVARPDLVP